MIGMKEILAIILMIVFIIVIFHFIRRRYETKNFRKYYSRKHLKKKE